MTNAEEAARRPPQTFSARVAIVMFLVGVFSFSAFITLSAFAPELAGGDMRAHALSRSAIGYAGLVKLLRATGTPVNVSRTDPDLLSSPSFIVLTPDDRIEISDINRMGGWTTLVVLPKWLTIPSFRAPGHVMQAPPMAETSVQAVLKELAPAIEVARDSGSARSIALDVDWRQTRTARTGTELQTGKIEALQTIRAPNITPVATTTNGKTVLGVIRSSEHGDVYVLSEPDLLNNQGIADRATARAGLALIDALRVGDSITFDVTLNGFARSRSLMRLALEPPLLAATLSFLLVAALIAWRAATREGPAAIKGRALAYGKRILADNSAALVRLAGREYTMAPRYADFIRGVVAQRIGVARDGSETTSTELDRIARARGIAQPFSTLAAEAAAAKNGGEAVTAARKLHAWTEEMIRATR